MDNGVLQGSVLFLFCAHHIRKSNIINKFVNDTRIGVKKDSEEGCLMLQQGLNQLGKWTMDMAVRI